MPVMKSKNRFAFDRDSSITLKAIGSAAITSTTSETGVALNTLTGAYWDNNEIPEQGFSAIVNVTAADAASADETYVLTFEADTSIAFASAVVVGTLTLDRDTAVGQYSVPLDGDLISALEPGATHLRVTATLGGTTPSLTYHSFLYAPVH